MGFWELVKPVRVTMWLGILVQVLGALAGLVPMVASVALVGLLLEGGQEAETWTWLWIALAGIAARLALVGTGLVLTHFADATLSRHLRVLLTEKLGRIPIGEAAKRSSGRVKKLVTDDVAALHTLVAHAGGDIAIGIVTAIAAFILLVTFSWPLALVALLPLIGFVAVFGSMMGRAMAEFEQWNEAKESVNAATVEFCRGIAVVKTFGQAGQASAQYRKAIDEYAVFFGRWMRPMIKGSAAGLAVVAAPSVIALMSIAGATMMSLGWVDLADVAAGIIFGVGLAAPLTQLESYSVRLRQSREAAARISEFLLLPELPVAASPAEIQGRDVRMEAVCFRYETSGPQVLDQVGLSLNAGKVTALVGPSGAGKSTLAALVPRFWDVTAGAVTLGGTDVRELDTTELYRAVGCMFQGTRLVPMSVRENLRLTRPTASDDELVEVARQVNLDERIRALPRGYDSMIGDDAAFSGGEAQRLAVARTLLADASILVLDEPTSFADPENEVAVQDAIARAASGRTTLIIAHRLSSIVSVDTIAVLVAGQIAQSGSHEQLLAVPGPYRRLWGAQSPQGGAA